MAYIEQLLNQLESHLPAWSPVLPFIGGGIVALTAGIWTIYHYMATRRLEARQPFLSKSLDLHFETATVVGKLVTLSPKNAQWQKCENEFWELYWSRLSVVESKQVEKAMVAIGKALKDYKQAPDDHKKLEIFEDSAYCLAHAIRKGLKRGWRGRL